MNKHTYILLFKFVSFSIIFFLFLVKPVYPQAGIRTVALFGEDASGTESGSTVCPDINYKKNIMTRMKTHKKGTTYEKLY